MENFKEEINSILYWVDLETSPFEAHMGFSIRSSLQNNINNLTPEEKILLYQKDLKLLDNLKEIRDHLATIYDFPNSKSPSEHWWWHLDKIELDHDLFNEIKKLLQDNPTPKKIDEYEKKYNLLLSHSIKLEKTKDIQYIVICDYFSSKKVYYCTSIDEVRKKIEELDNFITLKVFEVKNEVNWNDKMDFQTVESNREKVKKFLEEKKKNSGPPRVLKGKSWITGKPFEWSMDLQNAAAKTGEYALEEARKHDPKNGYIVYMKDGKKVREYVDGRIVAFDDDWTKKPDEISYEEWLEVLKEIAESKDLSDRELRNLRDEISRISGALRKGFEEGFKEGYENVLKEITLSELEKRNEKNGE